VESIGGPRASILIVDDDRLMAEMVGGRLEKLGYATHIETNAKNVIQKIDDTKPDLVLLDLIMPDISGMAVLKSVRQRFSAVDLPIIIVSARDDAQDITEALDIGANDFMTKPFNIPIAKARIEIQLKMKDLNMRSIDIARIETLEAMVITYNHEINNPLMIAMSAAAMIERSYSDKNVTVLNDALRRVSDIVKKIASFSNDQLVFDKYAGKAKMVKIS
jgi:DNA-binding response OmpR family regulator